MQKPTAIIALLLAWCHQGQQTAQKGRYCSGVISRVMVVAMHSARINVWRLARNLLLSLVIPCSMGVAVDYMTGLWPVVTIIVCAFFFPLSAIVVNRTALSELDRVIREAETESASQGTESDSPVDTICEGI